MNSPELSFLHGNRNKRCATVVDKHFDGYWTLQYVQEGRLEYCIDGRKMQIEGPVFYPHYPGPHFHVQLAEGCTWWHHRYVAFTGAMAARWEREGLFFHEPIIPSPEIDWAERMDDILSIFRNMDALSLRQAANKLEAILLDLASLALKWRKRPEWYAKALKLLNLNDIKPDYEEMAEELGMSYTAFRRNFAAEAGISLHQYLMRKRMQEAKHLLCQGNLPIKRIAEQLGFSDVYHFSRQFCALAGVPPAEMRQTSRESLG